MNKKIAAIFILLIAVQAVYSFISPTFGTSDCWKDLSTLSSYKGHSFSGADRGLVDKLYFLVADYHIVCDAGGFVLLSHDFPQDYFRDRLLFINRPAYPFLVHLVAAPFHLASNSYAATFAAAILTNLGLFFAGLALFYLLVKKYFGERTAFWSGILLIFSPFTHSWLVQPEGNIFGMFALVLSLYLLDNYAGRPSKKKLIIYSLIIGLTMLAKMNVAISFFIILVALYYQRIKEGALFFILHLVPFLLWYLFVTKAWGLPFGVQEVTKFGAGVWVFGLVKQPLYQAVSELISALPGYFTALFYAFLGIPLIASLVGLHRLKDKKITVLYGGLQLSLFAMMFALHFYLPRHAFLVFPLVYPLAVVGIERISEFIKNRWLRLVYYGLVYFLIIAPALLDIFKIYEYLGVRYS